MLLQKQDLADLIIDWQALIELKLSRYIQKMTKKIIDLFSVKFKLI